MNKIIHRLPNIFVEYKTCPDKNPGTKVPDLLSDFLYEAAKRNPSWEFKRSFDNFYTLTTLSEFHVYALGHKIATVGHKARGSNTGIYITCDALYKVIERGATKWSSKLNVALDTFKKYVKAITPQEHLERISASGMREFSTRAYRTSADYQNTVRELTAVLIKRKGPLSQEQMQALRVLGFDEATVNTLQDKLVDKVFYEEQNRLASSYLGVYEYSGMYYVGGTGDIPLYTYKPHELPVVIAEKLGLLKLVETDVLIPNVGIRVAANEFFLIMEKNNVWQEAA